MKTKTTKSLWQWAGACLLGLLAPITFLVSAQTLPPEVSAGVGWLTNQIQSSGEIQSEHSNPSATIPQIRAEVHDALARLKQAVPQPLRDLVAQPGEARTEYLARRALQKALADNPDPALLQELINRQNSDGGFGDALNGASSAVDTAYSLLAFSGSTALSDDKAQAALAYLSRTQKSAGGWGPGGVSHVYDTSLVLMALAERANQYDVATISSPAKNWLLARRTAGHFTTVLEDAVALMALSSQTADSAVLDPLVQALKVSQSTDGSWEQDAYLTALAVKALWSVKQIPPVPTTGEVQGSVVDAASSQPMADVIVQVLELPSHSDKTQTDGTFVLSGIPSGQYTLQLSRLGYETRQVSIGIQAGQVLSTGAISLKAKSLTASLSGVVKAVNGVAIKDAIVSVGTVSALTDANGAYALAGLNPGASSIGVTKPGYAQVAVEIVFEAGKAYAFSPTLYAANGVIPTSATLRGRLIDGSTRQPLTGAQIKIANISQTTNATGQFEFANQTAGAFELVATAAGYLETRASGTSGNGINNLGDIALTKAPVASAIFGTISDAANGAAIPAAAVEVVGKGISVQSDATGEYRIPNLLGTGFTLQVSATGYQTQIYTLTLPAVGESRVDLKLTKPEPSPISITGLHTSAAVYAPNEELAIEFDVVNSSTQAIDALIAAQVFDQDGNVAFELKANAIGLGANPPNLPVTLAASGSKEIELEKLFNRQAAGAYSALIQVRSINGQVLAEKAIGFEVSSKSILSGGILLNPPLVQAGTQTPVSIQADLFNYGNKTIAAGDVNLKVTLEHADTDVATAPRVDVSLLSATGQLNSVVGMARNARGELFVVNGADKRIIKVAPDGTQSIYFTLPSSAWPTDIDIDSQNTLWVSNAYGLPLYRITPTLEMSSLTVTGLYNITAIKTEANGALLLAGADTLGLSKLVRKFSDGTETTLWTSGLNKPMGVVKAADGAFVVSNQGDGTLVRVNAQTGAIAPFVSGLNRPGAIAQGPDGHFYVASTGDSTIVQVTADGQRTVYATGMSQPAGLAFDNSGNLFVSTQGDNSIYRVAAGTRSVTLFARGVAYQPWGLDYDAQGNLYIANTGNGSLTALTAAGEVKVLSTSVGAPRGVAAVGVDDVLVADIGGQQILRVTAAGKTVFAKQLSGPEALALDGNTVLVGETTVPRIRRFSLADGSEQAALETLVKAPTGALAGPSGSVFLLNAGFVTQVMADGTARIVYRGQLNAAVYDPRFNGLWGVTSGRDILKIDSQGQSQKLVTLPFSISSGVALTAAGDPVVADLTAKRVVAIHAQTGEISSLASLGATNPNALFGSSHGVIFALYNGQIQRLGSDGLWADVLSSQSSVYLYGASVSDNGQIVYSTHTNLYRQDPLGGAATLLKSGVNVYWGVLVADALSVHQGNQFVRYSLADGSATAVMPEFSGVNDIQVMPDGSIRFSDSSSRLFSWTPGTYPKRLGTSPGGYLAAVNGELYLVNGASLYQWVNGSAKYIGALSNINARGLALNPITGQLAVSDINRSSLLLLQGASSTVAKRYAGIYRPEGLAFDGQNRLYASSYSTGAIVRFDDVGSGAGVPVFVAPIGSPQSLGFDRASNTLFIGASSRLVKMGADGVTSDMGATQTGLSALTAIDGNTVVYADTANSMLHTWRAGGGITALAFGLASPSAIASAPHGGYYIANLQNKTLVAFDAGVLRPVAANLPNPHSIWVSAAGPVWVGGTNGQLVQVDPASGVQQPLPVAELLGSGAPSVTVAGLSGEASGKVALLHSSASVSANGIVQIEVQQPPVPPAAGTVVLERTVPMSELVSSEQPARIDFGAWVPPYSGDFKLEVSTAGASGAAHNVLHVGAFAQGKLLSAVSEVPAGDQAVALTLNLKGADFTSISRVDTGLVRPLVANERPSGMVGDKAGNVWYTTANSLKKTSPGGEVSTVVTGLTTAFGLAVDSRERFFLPARVGSSSTYQLLMVQTDGSQQVVADLGVTRANGVAVNSRDEVLVGSPGRMLKVHPDSGVVTTFTTQGLPNPRGLAIDGKDNVYVQNESDVVTMVTASGQASILYNKGDGIEHPAFEGDGYPNIAADCADNFYIAPFRWAKIEQNGEEHTLAQVVPRTGRAAALFNGLQISSKLGDIDYLAYDRFGSRILMWADYVNEIWQAPVTCGAISVEAHLMSKPGQTLTGFDRAPNATMALPDGRTEYVWSLRDVGSNGLNIGFDTLLKGLVLGQQAPVAESGYLLFKNTFSPNDFKVPLAIPVVTVGNIVKASVGSDKPVYSAGETARLTTQLENINARSVAGTLTVSVYDSAGVSLGNVLNQPVTLAEGETLAVGGDFAVGSTVPGNYTVVAHLHENGVLVAQAKAVFAVKGDAIAAAARSSLRLDKARYAATETVSIQSRVDNLTRNMPIEGLKLRLRVLDAAGSLRQEKSVSLSQLAAGSTQAVLTLHALAGASQGSYKVEQTLLSAANEAIDFHEAPFDVLAAVASGLGIAGEIAATPQTVVPGASVALAYNVMNNGNAELVDLPLVVRVVNPSTGEKLAEFPFATTLAVGAAQGGNRNWVTQGQTGDVLVAVLSAQLPSGERTLAQTTFTLSKPSAQVDVEWGIAPSRPRVLILAECSQPRGPSHGGHLHGSGRKHDAGWRHHPVKHPGCGNHCMSCDPTPPKPQCGLARAQAIDDLLNDMGIEHRVTTDPAVFRSEMRTGAYNVYWLSGALQTLDHSLIKELREGVRRGEGLLLDGTTNLTNEMLSQVAGAKIAGISPYRNPSVNLSGALGAGPLPIEGVASYLTLKGGWELGSLLVPRRSYPAVVGNAFGRGQSVSFAFDLVESQARYNAWRGVLDKALTQVTPAAASSGVLAPGAWLPLQVTVNNLGAASDAGVRLTLPAGMSLETAEPDSLPLDTALPLLRQWRLPMTAASQTTLQLGLRVPDVSGAHSLIAEAGYWQGGSLELSGAPESFPLTVGSVGADIDALDLALAALPVSRYERSRLLHARLSLQQAESAIAVQRWDIAINALLLTNEHLSALTSVQTEAAKLAVARILQYTQWKWAQRP